MINEAVREYVSHDAGDLEATLRRVVKEELNSRAV